MLATAVGSAADCGFAEWVPRVQPPCPAPSYLERLPGSVPGGGGCFRFFAHAALAARRSEGERRETSFSALEGAMRACGAASWCAGVTKLPPSARKRKSRGAFQLRELPLKPYDGRFTNRVSWLRVNETECADQPV